MAEFEKRIVPAEEPLVAGYRRRGRCAFAPAVQLEMALAAHRLVTECEPTRAVGIEFHGAAELDDQSTYVARLSLLPSNDTSVARVVIGPERAPGGEPGQLVGQARILGTRQVAPRRVDRAEVERRCQVPYHNDEASAELAKQGTEIGGALAEWQKVCVGPDEVAAWLELPEPSEDDAAFTLHPGVIQAGLELVRLLRTQAASADVRAGELVAIESVEIFEPIQGSAWCWARLTCGAASGNVSPRYEITFTNRSGGVLARFTGVAFGAVQPTERDETSFPATPDESLFVERTWLEVERGPRRELPRGVWVLVGDDEALLREIGQFFAAEGREIARVAVGKAYRGLRRGNGNCELTDAAQVERLLGDCLRKHERVAGVVYAADGVCGGPAPLDIGAEGMFDAVVRGTTAIARLWQGLARVVQSGCEFWLITRNAQATCDSVGLVNPAQTPLIGAMRVAAKEFTGFRVRTVDLAGDETPDWNAARIVDAVRTVECPIELAIRGERWFEPRLRQARLTAPAEGGVAIRPGGVYLITGGQAGVGLELAGWLVSAAAEKATPGDQDAGHAGDGPLVRLVLVNRRPLPDEATWDQYLQSASPDDVGAARIRAVRLLRSGGADVWPAAVDVADGPAMESLLSEIQARYGRLDGVIHAAGVLRDRTLLKLTEEDLQQVLRPKVQGAWLLHRLLAEQPLDFLAICSSVAALTAGEGQTAHVAANLFEDSVAHVRRAAGMPALSVNWGYWGETGVVASPEYRQSLAEFGVRPMTSAVGRQGFACALASGMTQIAVADLDWRRLAVELWEAPTEWAGVERAVQRASVRAWSELEPRMRSLAGFDADCDALVSGYISAALANAGLFAAPGERHTVRSVCQSAGVLPRYARLVERLLEVLVQDDRLARDGDVLVAKKRASRPRLRTQQAELLERYPEAEALCRLLERCGSRLLEALRGEVDPLALLMPEGDAAAVQGAYADSPLNRFYQQHTAAAVAEVGRRFSHDRPLEILEVGAGTGATTAAVAATLRPGCFRYVYTDVSPHLTAHGRRRFGGRIEFEFRAFDVERPAETQGLVERTIDVIVAANVLHATRDVSAALSNLRKLLRPGGLLVLGETTRDKRFALATFGLTEGWWRFDDRRLRTDSPLLSVDRWVGLLRREGFSAAAGWPRNVPELELAGEHVIVAMLPDAAIHPANEVGAPHERTDANGHDEGVQPTAETQGRKEQDKNLSITVPSPVAAMPTDDLARRVEQDLRGVFAEALEWDVDLVLIDRPFHELGLDSLMAIDAVRRIKSRYRLPVLTSAVVFAHPTVRQLARHLSAVHPELLTAALLQDDAARPVSKIETTSRPSSPSRPTALTGRDESHVDRALDDALQPASIEPAPVRVGEVAIIGYACKFPGAADASQYWELLQHGRNAVGPPPVERVDVAAGLTGASCGAGWAMEMQGGFLPAATLEEFDPLFFHISPAEAAQMEPRQRLFLETAYAAIEHAGYAGGQLDGSRTGVFVGAGAQVAVDADDEVDVHWATGITPSVLASRVAYHLNLRGPSLTVDTACSSSMMALHLAVSSLRCGESDLAVVGGVHLNVQPLNYRAFVEMGALAADGRAKAFDHRADGFVPGEGCGAVLLKPLAQARADGDRVYGVIKGTAANNDGRSNGLTAPNPEAQCAVIDEAWRDAGIDPATLSYVEAHGTGTALGDPIEVRGLSDAFARHTRRRQFCRLGSVKSNIGHAEPAAGMASLIKVLLSFEHRQLPPTLHFESPQRELAFEETPLVVNDRLAAWGSTLGPRRAGINSFGISGTNVHVVLEEPPAELPRPTWPERPRHVLALSACSRAALRELAARFAAQIEGLADNSPRRLAPIGSDAVAGTHAWAATNELTAPHSLADVCYTANTGRPALAVRQLVSGSSPAELAARLRSIAVGSVAVDSPATEMPAPPQAVILLGGAAPLDAALALYDTQPVFRQSLDACAAAFEGVCHTPLVAWLRDQVHRREAAAGSSPAHAAAQCAVQWALERMWRSWGIRGPATGGGLGWLTAACVSGALPLRDALELSVRAARLLSAVGGELDVPRQRQGLIDAIATELRRVRFVPPLTDLLAPGGATGSWREAILDPGQWAEWIVTGARFQARESDVVLSLSWDEALSVSEAAVATVRPSQWIPSLQPGREAWTSLCSALDGLVARGVRIDWAGFDGPYARRRTAVAGYPLQRRVVRRLRPRRPAASAATLRSREAWSANAQQADDRGWLHRPSWLPTPLESSRDLAYTAWRVMGDESAPRTAIARRLVELGCDVALDPSTDDRARGLIYVVDCEERNANASPVEVCDALTGALAALLTVARRLAEPGDRFGPVLVVAVDRPISDLTPHDGPTLPRLSPMAASLAAATRTLAQEAPQNVVRFVHLRQSPEELADLVALELAGAEAPNLVSYVGRQRYAPAVLPVAVAPESGATEAEARSYVSLAVRPGGTYLLTGGPSGVGLELASALVEACPNGALRLALVNRTPLPAESHWEAWLAEHDARDATSARIAGVRRLRSLGAQVLTLSADVGDERALREAIDEVRRSFGPILGVIHAAGELCDRRLCVATVDDLRTAVWPKAAGARALERVLCAESVSRSLPDWIVYCSSVAAVYGRIGQAAYAAANAYLDGLAENLPRGPLRMSLAWGPWADVGMAARTFDAAELVQRGVCAIDPPRGRRLFRAALTSGQPRLIADRGSANRFSVGDAPAASGPRRQPRPLENANAAAPIWATWIAAELADCLGLQPGDVSPNRNFQELGLDSMTAALVRRRLEKRGGAALDPTLLFAYPTVQLLAAHLATVAAPGVAGASAPSPSPALLVAHEPLAIIGLACRFGRCNTPQAFWQAICAGDDLVTALSPERAALAGIAMGEAPIYGGWLPGVEQFDAELFGLTPREARRIDPQQRLLLEVVWEAVQQAGYAPAALGDGRCGLFVGVSNNEYLSLLARAGQLVDPHTGAGASLAMASNRVSYFCDWHGPSLSVDTACSSSLAALHLARQALAAGECRAAVAAGVNVILSVEGTLACQQAGMMAADGRCKPFDQRADGYVRSEGVAAVVLKPLHQAQADGDHIWAVLKSTALNHDGHAKAGLTAPSPHAQRDALLAAWQSADAGPDSLSLVEAHGTGTPLGDPIELLALREAMAASTTRRAFCALGSVKSNLGHAEAAAGMAGLLKAVLAVHHRAIPPTAQVVEPNRALSLESSPFYWNDRLRPFTGPGACRAGVSSFGFGGTNVHAVVEEPPPSPSRCDRIGRPGYVLACSAASPAALVELATRLADAVQCPPESLDDVVHTINVSRTGLPHRLAVVGATRSELVNALRRFARNAPATAHVETPADEWVYCGDGTGGGKRQGAYAALDQRFNALPGEARETLAGLLIEPLDPQVRQLLEQPTPSIERPPHPSSAAQWLEQCRILAQLYALGANIDWQRLDAGRECHRVPLPNYPFQRQRCWIDPPSVPSISIASGNPPQAPAKRAHAADWLYEQVWIEDDGSRQSAARELPAGPWLICADETDRVAMAVVERLRTAGQKVLVVLRGRTFAAGDGWFELTIDQPAEYDRLIRELAARSAAPARIVHLWSRTCSMGVPDRSDQFQADLTASLRSAVYLVQAWKRVLPERPLELCVVTTGAQPVSVEQVTRPLAGAVWGFVRAVDRECYPVTCRAVELLDDGSARDDALAGALVDELSHVRREAEAARSATRRWTSARRRLTLPAQGPSLLSMGGVYLITGGLGGIGLAVAEHLARNWRARLALLGRRGELPAAAAATFAELGTEVLTLPADVADQAAMERALSAIERRFGRLDGIVHAAGVIESARLTDMTAEHIERTLAPKVAGAVVLDTLTRRFQPRFLALFSSLAGLDGNVLQTDYSAASRFLDSFAHWRTAQGLATRVIDWPTWADVGRAADVAHGLAPHETLPSAVGLEILETALRQQPVQWIVAPPEAPPQELADHPAAPAVSPGTTAPAALQRSMEEYLLGRMADSLEVPVATLDAARGVVDLGVDSILAASLARQLALDLGRPVRRTALFDFATIERLAGHLCQTEPEACARLLQASPSSSAALAQAPASAKSSVDASGTTTVHRPDAGNPIAVVAMAGRFAGAENLDQYWRALIAGTDLVREASADRWDIADGAIGDRAVDALSKCYGGFLGELDQFDPDYFHISLREAQAMHPQQRVLLEVTAEALERYGYAGRRLAGSRTGVFVAAAPTAPSFQQLAADPTHLATGQAPAMLANRLSYWLDLRGPSLVIDTACSSSLVALHLAVQALRRGEIDQALVAGVQAGMPLGQYRALHRIGALAVGGRCRAFDDAADGYVPGEGAGVVLLKPLAQALAQGDEVLGVIRGSAVAHGGLAAGLTVPRAEAQADVIRAALADAGAAPDSIQCIEAHGTGTALGDPIELMGIDLAYGERTKRRQFIALGSVKSNLGHLEAAAGMAALLKTLLAMRHKQLPATLHLRRPNGAIDFASSVCYVCDRMQPWPASPGPRRAGVSAFGFGGANAHLILEESPQAAAVRRPTAGPERSAHVVALSAASPETLRDLAGRLAEHLRDHPQTALADIAWTLNGGRPECEHWLAAASSDAFELRDAWAAFAAGEMSRSAWPALRAGRNIGRRRPKIAWLFTGQGSQSTGMARQLHETEPRFRAALAQCAEFLRSELDVPLADLLYEPALADKLGQTRYAQPVLAAVEWSLAQTWLAWGIRPDALLGHSLGEYVAAAVAGVFAPADMFRLVARRAKWMQALPSGGGMAAVGAGAERLAALLATAPDVSIAAHNAPSQTVLSGPRASLARLAQSRDWQGLSVHMLDVSHAFHSSLVEPMLAALTAEARTVPHAAPALPLVSNLTGQLQVGEGPGPAYWARHARQAVQFSAGMQTLLAMGCNVFLEIGPRPTLVGLARQAGLPATTATVHSLAQGADDWRTMTTALAELCALGAAVDWAAFDAPWSRRRLALPTTPLRRRSMRIDSEAAAPAPAIRAVQTTSGDGSAMDEPNKPILWQRTWRPAPLAAPPRTLPDGVWLLLVDGQREADTPIAAALAARLRRAELQSAEVRLDQPFTGWTDAGCGCDVTDSQQLQRLLAALDEQRLAIAGMIVLAGHQPTRTLEGMQAELRALHADLTRCLGGAVRLFQHLVDRQPSAAPEWWSIGLAAGSHAHPEPTDPCAAAMATLTRIVPQEFPGAVARSVDLPLDDLSRDDAVETILGELLAESCDSEVAYRGRSRLVPRVTPCEAPPPQVALPVRAGGVYLITGGLGDVGRTLAGWLVAAVAANETPGNQGAQGHAGGGTLARLVLVNRTPMPDESTWDELLQSTSPDDVAVLRIRAVQRLRSAGAEVWLATADVANPAAMDELLRKVRARYGRLDGVIHAAGVLRDGLLWQRTEASLVDTLRAKTLGTWVLDRLTRRDPPALFMVCSSMSAWQGGAGHASYAAANAAAAALVEARRATGRPALAVHWGPWAGTRAAELPHYRAALAAQGIQSLSQSEALAALECALVNGGTQWGVLRTSAPVDESHRLQIAVRSAASEIETQAASVSAQLRSLAPLDGMLQQICGTYVAGWLREGLGRAATFTLDDVLRSTQVAPIRAPLVQWLLNLLVAAGRLEQRGEVYQAVQGMNVDDAAELLRVARRQFPAQAPLLNVLEHSGAALGDILAGRRSAVETLFAGASADALEGLYAGSPVVRLLGDAVGAAVAKLAKSTGRGRPLRIIELGAGSGATTRRVLDRLADEPVEYTLTDVSPALVRRAADAFLDRPTVRTAQLDIERDPVAQGFIAGGYDVVLAANVLHATRRLDETLAHVGRLLAPGGVLALVESVATPPVGWLTFGLTDGWWRFEGDATRSDGPLLDAAGWSAALVRHGFHDVQTLPARADLSELEQRLILAERRPTKSLDGGRLHPTETAVLQARPTATSVVDERVGDQPAIDAARLVAREELGAVLRRPPQELSTGRTFQDLGLDSILALEFLQRLHARLGWAGLTPGVLFAHPSLDELVEHFVSRQRSVDKPSLHRSRPRTRDIAVIGYAGKFPMADSAEAFWQCLAKGRNLVGPLPADRRRLAAGYDQAAATWTDATAPRGGFLAHIDQFDPLEFHISPAEACEMDPRQRLFLETAWRALEHAGHAGRSLSGTRTGVFVGVGPQDYLSQVAPHELSQYAATGTTPSALASRIAYLLDFHGPCLAIDAACSSSLAALALAVDSLRSGQCQAALAGGVHLNLRLGSHVVFDRLGALSRSAACRTFSAQADGFVPGEAVGAVLLKPLEAALAAGDHVYGVIAGVAINNDGRTNGLTAPNPAAQRDAIVAAWQDAALDPTTLDYVEAHGTGTPLGDPIEVEAIGEAMRRFTNRRQFCRIGSVKSNLGHSEAAAGVTGLIKLLLALEHGQLPPTLHLTAPNLHIRFEDSPLAVNDRLTPWRRGDRPRRAALSAFGFSGTNVHVVLEDFPTDSAAGIEPPGPQVLVISARSAQQLRAAGRDLAEYLASGSAAPLADVCWTLQTGRPHRRRRWAIVADDAAVMAAQLRLLAAQRGAHCLPGAVVFDSTDETPVADRFDRDVAPRLRRLAADQRARLRRACDGPTWRDEIRGRFDVVEQATMAPSSGAALAEAAAALYALGVDLAWDSLSDGAGRARVPLPPAPLRPESYWLPALLARADAAHSAATPLSPPSAADLLHEVVWRPTPWAPSGNEISAGVWLIFDDETGLGAELEPRLAEVGRVVRVVRGPKFEQLGPHEFQVSPASEADYVRLLQQLAGGATTSAQPLAGVVQLWSYPSAHRWPQSLAALQRRQETGVDALLALAHALATTRTYPATQLLVVTTGALRLASEDQVAMDRGSLLGLAQVLPMELPGLVVRAVDVAEQSSSPDVASQLLWELSTHDGVATVAYRDGQRHLPSIAKAAGPTVNQAFCPEAGEVHLITGGLGGIGRQLAHTLAKLAPVRLVLVGRRAEADESLLNSLRAAGSEAEYRPCDVSNEADVTSLIEHIQRRYGRLDGVWHAAGLLDRQRLSLRSKSRESFQQVLAPKVQGTWLLWHFTRPLRPRRFVLFSSISALSGTLAAGQSDYAAASRFQWSFAAATRNAAAETDTGAVCLLLSAWQGTGMTAEAAAGPIVQQLGLLPLNPDRAIAAVLNAALAPDHVAVMQTDRERFQPDRLLAMAVAEATAVVPQGGADLRVVDGDERLHAETARRILEQCAQFLRVPLDQCDARTNFMELGFDSVVALQLARWLEARLGLPIDATLLFHYSTASDLAAKALELRPAGLTHEAVGPSTALSAEPQRYGKVLDNDDSTNVASQVADLAGAERGLVDGTSGGAFADGTTTGDSHHTSAQLQRRNEAKEFQEDVPAPIAVVGLACRLPGAGNPDDFWRNLCQGRDCITDLPAERRRLLGARTAHARTRGGYLSHIEDFDAALFQLSVREARLMDPQQRLFLEVAWEALESAGYPPQGGSEQAVGVYVGVSTQDYVQLVSDSGDRHDPHLRAGNALSMIANRVSYLLNLTGPSLSVDTACSSSLVAVHLACQALRNGEAQMALAGGVHLNLNAEGDEILTREGMLAADGRAKVFDDRADGFVRGEGAAVVALKPLAAAVRDGDVVWAVIRGTATNNDGHAKAGLAAPNPRAQTNVVLSAWRQAQVSPESIGLVEAHGTGTALGDPLELQALCAAFERFTRRRGFCAVGSVKSNVGHLEAAAGMAGLVKAILAVAHGRVPPTLHFQRPNRSVQFENSPLFVADRLQSWPQAGPRRAGVSSFGFGGTNAHLVVEQSPPESNAAVASGHVSPQPQMPDPLATPCQRR